MTELNFADGPPVPLMTEGLIDAHMLRQLVSDLNTFTMVLGVREKSGPGSYADATESNLVAAVDRLTSGTCRAVQVRYCYDGSEWTDTIMHMPTGFLVVRCRHEN
jgi:hypothetical protein